MRLLAFIMAVACGLTGCATSHGGKPGTDPDVARVRAEMVRQYTWLGIDPKLADAVRITVLHCAASGESSDGPYVCAESACSQIGSGCVHAWESSGFHSDVVTFMFAGLAKDWTVRHEVGHFVHYRWGDSLSELAGNNGHPLAVHIGGKLIKTKDLIAGARWPAVVRGLKFWRRAEGSEFGDAILDGAGNVLHVRPVPGLEADGSGI